MCLCMYVCMYVHMYIRRAGWSWNESSGRRPEYDLDELVQQHKDLTLVGILILALFAFVATIVCDCAVRGGDSNQSGL